MEGQFAGSVFSIAHKNVILTSHQTKSEGAPQKSQWNLAEIWYFMWVCFVKVINLPYHQCTKTPVTTFKARGWPELGQFV